MFVCRSKQHLRLCAVAEARGQTPQLAEVAHFHPHTLSVLLVAVPEALAIVAQDIGVGRDLPGGDDEHHGVAADVGLDQLHVEVGHIVAALPVHITAEVVDAGS